MSGKAMIPIAVGVILITIVCWLWLRHSRTVAQSAANAELGEMIEDFFCSSRKLSLRGPCWIMSYSHMIGMFDPSIEIRVSLSGRILSTDPDDLDVIVTKYESAE